MFLVLLLCRSCRERLAAHKIRQRVIVRRQQKTQKRAPPPRAPKLASPFAAAASPGSGSSGEVGDGAEEALDALLPEALALRADSMELLHRRCRVLRLDSEGVPDSRLSVRCFSAGGFPHRSTSLLPPLPPWHLSYSIPASVHPEERRLGLHCLLYERETSPRHALVSLQARSSACGLPPRATPP